MKKQKKIMILFIFLVSLLIIGIFYHQFFNNKIPNLSFVSNTYGCSITDTFFSDYKQLTKPTSDGANILVTKFGDKCQVGEYIEPQTCTLSSYSSGGVCIKLFTDDYKKEYVEDRLNFETACSGKNCFEQSWFLSAITNKYVGYKCKSCSTNSDVGNVISPIPTDKCELLKSVDKTISSCQYTDKGLCSGNNKYYCSSGYLYKVQYTYDNYYDYYLCEINGNYDSASFNYCSGGCSNGVCLAPDNNPVVCIANSKWCDNNIFKECNSLGTGFTSQDCGNNICTENSPYSQKVMCINQTYYCLSNGVDCNLASVKTANCYDTLDLCKAAKKVVCLSSDKKTCVNRTGKCLDGEFENAGTDLNMAWLQCNNREERNCNLDSDCISGSDCVVGTCNKDLLSSKCVYNYNTNCNNQTKCEDKTFVGIKIYEWKDVKEQQGGYICSFTGYLCTTVDKSYCGIKSSVFWIGVIISLSIFIFIIYKIVNMKDSKKFSF